VSADGLQTYSQPLKKCIFLGGRGGGKFLKKYSDQLFLANQAILRTFVFLKYGKYGRYGKYQRYVNHGKYGK
jgi:hypothetical protein